MDPYNKVAIVILFMLFVNSYSVAVVSFSRGDNPAESLSKVKNQRNVKESIMLEALSDYDKPGPNPKHDQGKGKPAPGGGATSNT